MKHTYTKTLLTSTLALSLLAASANAQIVFDSVNGSQGDYNGETTVVAGYTPDTATNSALLLAVSVDGSLATPFANFGGNAMTLLASDTRVAIFGTVLSSTTAGDITLKTGVNNAETILTYGTISGIDTSVFGSLPNTTGATGNGTADTVTMNAALTGLSSSDYVLNVFSNNSAHSFTGATPSAGLSELNFFSGGAGASYTGIVAGGVIGSAGDYTSSVLWTPGTGSGNNTAFGAQIAFTAIPEPSAYALLGGLMALGLVVSRRRARG